MTDAPDHMLAAPALLAVLSDADGDDERLVALCSREIRASRAYQEQVRDVLEAAAARLRTGGVPMHRIAALAGVTDSYLARRLIKVRGVARLVDRR